MFLVTDRKKNHQNNKCSCLVFDEPKYWWGVWELVDRLWKYFYKRNVKNATKKFQLA